MQISRLLTTAALLGSLAASAQAADATAGKTRFAEMCGLCHTAEPTDGLGGMGPSLRGLAGQPAAMTDNRFPYSAALRGSKLVWDAATLDGFLASPSKLVPGTGMVVSVRDKTVRDDVVAYLQSLKPAPRP